MTENRYFGFIGHCDRCGVRLTYALVCEACELVRAGQQPARGQGECDNTRIVDKPLPPNARKHPGEDHVSRPAAVAVIKQTA